MKIDIDKIKNTPDFDCLPRCTQIECIIWLFDYYGEKYFSEQDIANVYRQLQIKSGRSGKPVKPTIKQISGYCKRLIDNNIISVSDNGRYEILNADYSWCNFTHKTQK
ncbi:MAG: hypothetical protein K2J40_05685 [Ruminococcus sp.]|nr:hypothetical protein [Ruminococcus sp.]